MKLSDLTTEEWYARLNARRAQQRTEALKWWQYVDLEQPLHFIARILREQSDRFPPLLVAWPTLVLDSVDERLTIEGFRQAGSEDVVDELQDWRQINDLDEVEPEAHYAVMTSGMGFLLGGPGDDGTPMSTFEYPDQMAVEIDPRTRQVVAGLKVWCSDSDTNVEDRGALYLPGRAIEFELDDLKSGEVTEYGAWGETLLGDPRLPDVPIQPMYNRVRKGAGRSELVEIKPLVDAANQVATNMMAAIEHHAVGRKYLLGASEEDFVDENGNKIPLWKVATGDVWAVPHAKQERGEGAVPEMKIGQFAASDLRNFHETYKMLATVAASVYGLPPNYMGYVSDNPASAEAIRYSLDRLIRRTERRQIPLGGAWERHNRVLWAIAGNDPAEVRNLETVWRDPSTPTKAAMADAAVKLFSAGVIDDEQTWIDIGYGVETRKNLRDRRARIGGRVAADLVRADEFPLTPDTLPQVPSAPALTV